MSAESAKLIQHYVDWMLKVVLALCAWFSVSIFNDMKRNIDTTNQNIISIRERLIRLEDKVDSHTIDLDNINQNTK